MKKFLAVLVIIVSFAKVVNAEVLTLKEAISIALKDNPQIKAVTWSVEAEKAKAFSVKSRYYPRLMLEERFMRTDSPTYAFMAKLNQEKFSQSDFMIDSINNPSAINDFQTSLKFEQPLYVPRLIEGIRISKKSIEVSSLKLKHIKEKVVRDVLKSYLGVLIAKQYVQVAKKAIKDIEEHKRLAEVRYKTGLGLYSDVLRAEVALKDAEKGLLSAQNSLDTAKRMLALVLGKTEPVDVADSEINLTLKGIKDYILSAESRSDLRSMRKALEMAREAVKLEKSTFLPEVGIGGSYQLNDHNTPFGSEGHSYNIMAFV
ncbi:MAG: TolC family protein, partial [Nitrospirae bacterium]